MAQLPVGTYQIRVTYPGLADFMQDGVVLTIGQTVHLTMDPQAVSTINTMLAAGAFPRLGTRQLTRGLFPTALTETEWSAKMNDLITPRNTVMARVAGTNRNESADAFNSGGLTGVSARGSSRTRDTTLTTTWTAILGSHATNDLRGQVATRTVDLHTTGPQGPGMLIAGMAEFGRPYQ